MRLLLDTNALLWLLNGDDRLGAVARRQIETAETLAVSVGSLWEIAVKVSIKKLAPIPTLHAAVRDLGFERLTITDDHLAELQTLPLLHRDPFDRLLISQAIVEGLAVATTDGMFGEYDVAVLDART